MKLLKNVSGVFENFMKRNEFFCGWPVDAFFTSWQDWCLKWHSLGWPNHDINWKLFNKCPHCMHNKIGIALKFHTTSQPYKQLKWHSVFFFLSSKISIERSSSSRAPSKDSFQLCVSSLPFQNSFMFFLFAVSETRSLLIVEQSVDL